MGPVFNYYETDEELKRDQKKWISKCKKNNPWTESCSNLYILRWMGEQQPKIFSTSPKPELNTVELKYTYFILQLLKDKKAFNPNN